MPENVGTANVEITPSEGAEKPAQAAESTETDWKAEARKHEARAKDYKKALDEAKPILSQWDALQQASKTDQERLQEEATRWQTEATTWRTAAVSSRVETLASADFADPSDALAAIADPAKYLDAGGQINEGAIKADLEALLERKPHWRRASDAPAGPRVPAPNPAQGSGGGTPASADPAQVFASTMHNLLQR